MILIIMHLLLLLLCLPIEVYSITCTSCYNYNGQVCINAPSCQGDYCLFEQITQANGLVTVRKSCTSQSFYRFDDGTTNNLLNQCVERSIYQYRYLVKICSDSDYCNSDCGSVNPIVTPLTLPTIPTIPTMPTIAPRGTVICFNCETSDGSDCQTNSCTATYCLYQRKLSGNQMTLKKSCLNEPLVLLDDGTAAQATGVCEIRNTANSQYLIKICDDYNLCNNICDPSQPLPSTIPPQRQPLMSCYSCEGYGVECFSGVCSANYCVFEQQRRLSSGLMYYKKTCSALPYVEYPDGKLSQTANQCEIRTINDIEYQIRICNNQNNCNVGCNGNGVGGIVTCSQCSAQNQLDCTGTTCQGAYCLFERQTILATGQIFVKKSCTNLPLLEYPDNSLYHSFGSCEFRQISGNSYASKVCNATNYCNTACADLSVVTTDQPLASQSYPNRFQFISNLFVIFTAMILLRKL